MQEDDTTQIEPGADKKITGMLTTIEAMMHLLDTIGKYYHKSALLHEALLRLQQVVNATVKKFEDAV